ncbi:MAG: glycosyltransferase family 4 protein, partial [Deltaproteobacteria bacterium]|nr:glycosyltransferase family 4 protein [Deltaproteobacteria bacterium]
FSYRINQFNPSVSLLLHAYRSGYPWLNISAAKAVPLVTLLTGTDVNQGLADPVQQKTIRTVLSRSNIILLQNRKLFRHILAFDESLSQKLFYLPPGVELGSAPCDLRRRIGLSEKTLLFFCPAGIRPVKGVLSLLEMCDLVAQERHDFHIVFSGPILDEAYADAFFKALEQRPFATYLGIIEPQAMAAAIKSADVIVNNSVAEGIPNSLMEAARLGVPILAREIPGNAEIVTHPDIGMLYQNPNLFKVLVLRLFLDREKPKQPHIANPTLYDPLHEAEVLERQLKNAVLCLPHGRIV